MISAYILNASGELTTGDIAGIMGTIEPDSYGKLSDHELERYCFLCHPVRWLRRQYRRLRRQPFLREALRAATL